MITTLLFNYHFKTSTDISYGAGSFIMLGDNNLTRFDEDVFLPILEEIESNSPSNAETGVEFDNS